VAAGLAAVLTSSVTASSFTATPPVLASSPSPFAAGCEGVPQSGTNYLNAEVEPWVDVNPTDSSNIIGVYQQDRWSNGGAHGLVAAVTHDGGTTWSHSWAHFSICSGGNAANGGDYERTSDPWVSFAPNGDAYQIAISFNDSNFTNGVLVSKLPSGGSTWSEPTTLIRDTAPFSFNDKESITADPTNSSYVYAVWDRSRFPGDRANIEAFHSFAFRGDAYFSRTTNGGASWEPAHAIFAPRSNMFTIGHQIVVRPNGTLVDIFDLIKGSGVQPVQANKFAESVMLSTDKGLTWSDPIRIDSDMSVRVVDPDTGQPVRTGAGLPDIAVDPNNGYLYAVWSDGRFSGGDHDDVALSRSLDGGLTWSTPIKVNQTPPGIAAFTPAVHVADDGTVGVTYYDFRNNTPAPGALTDYFLVHSHDAGATWGDEVQLTKTSFDIEIAPVAGGYFLGDYEGLASIGNGFVPFFIQANTGNTANRTDAFFTTAGP
jgi:hypothetical protein